MSTQVELKKMAQRLVANTLPRACTTRILTAFPSSFGSSIAHALFFQISRFLFSAFGLPRFRPTTSLPLLFLHTASLRPAPLLPPPPPRQLLSGLRHTSLRAGLFREVYSLCFFLFTRASVLFFSNGVVPSLRLHSLPAGLSSPSSVFSFRAHCLLFPMWVRVCVCAFIRLVVY